MGERTDEVNRLPDRSADGGVRVNDASGAATRVESTDRSDTGNPRSVADAEGRIEQTRAEMGRTIDQIQEKLAPETLIQQAKEAVQATAANTIQTFEDKVHPEELVKHIEAAAHKVTQDAIESIHEKISPGALIRETRQALSETARETGMSIVEAIKENPIPAAIAGLGLGWLYMSASRKSGQTNGYRQTSSGRPTGKAYYGASYDQNRGGSSTGAGVLDRAQDVIGNVQDRVGQVAQGVSDRAGAVADQVRDTAGQVRDSAGQLVGQVQDTASSAAEYTQYKASQLGDQVQDTADWAVGEFNWLLDRAPLALGAAAAVAGVALGLAVPQTRQEHLLMGETRDRLVDQVQDTAGDLTDRAQSVVKEVVTTVSGEVKNQGLTLDTAQQAAQGIVEKVQNVAQQAVNAGKEEARNQGLTPEAISGQSGSNTGGSNTGGAGSGGSNSGGASSGGGFGNP